MSDETALTIDLGNTNASAALARVAADGFVSVERLATWEHASLDGALDLVDTLLGNLEPVAVSAVSSVGALDAERAVRGLLEDRGFRVLIHPPPGVDLAIESPETCGFDRQYGMRAGLNDASRRGFERVIVIDAGTALTVDAGRIEAGGGRTFLGGAIALGPGQLAAALTAAGARLPAFSLEGDAPALGRSTTDALRSGVITGFRGVVRELCSGIAAEAFGGTDGVVAYLTGGARGFARTAVGQVFAETVEDESLVHAGLARAALDVRAR